MNNFDKLTNFIGESELTHGEILSAVYKIIESKQADYVETEEKYKNLEMKINLLDAMIKSFELLSTENCRIRERRLARSNLLIDIADIEIMK